MDISKMLVELREQRDRVEAAIASLERLSIGHGKRRGRPPAWLTKVTQAVALTGKQQIDNCAEPILRGVSIKRSVAVGS